MESITVVSSFDLAFSDNVIDPVTTDDCFRGVAARYWVSSASWHLAWG